MSIEGGESPQEPTHKKAVKKAAQSGRTPPPKPTPHSTEPPTDAPLSKPHTENQLTGKRLQLAIYADVVAQRGGNLTDYLTPRQLEILEKLRDETLQTYPRVAEQVGLQAHTLHDLVDQLIQKLELQIPAYATGTRIRLEHGRPIPLAGLNFDAIHVTLSQLRNEAQARQSGSHYQRLIDMSDRIEKVGRDVVSTVTATIPTTDGQNTTNEDPRARADLITLYSGTIAGALNDYIQHVDPNELENLTRRVLEGLPNRIPRLLERAAKAQASTGRNSTGVIFNRITRHLIANILIGHQTTIGEDRAMRFHQELQPTIISEAPTEPPTKAARIQQLVEAVSALPPDATLNIAELSKQVGIDRKTLSELINRLESEGTIPTLERGKGRPLNAQTQEVLALLAQGLSPIEIIGRGYPEGAVRHIKFRNDQGYYD